MDIKTFKRELKQKLSAIKYDDCESAAAETLANSISDIIKYIDESNPMSPASVSVEVCATEVKGILYYVDAFQNVYRTEDILESRENPRIIGKAILK
jgi:Asp-tRNA(Asn)/Glu-tRNA(Gln) amidotransferase C subunit